MERSSSSNSFFLSFFFCCCYFSFFLDRQAGLVALAQNVINVGVVLDIESPSGKEDWASISMALEDFYAAGRGNLTSRVILHLRDSKNDTVGAASAALDLLKNVKVQAIIGPSTSSQTKFVINLGNKTHVPIVSFSATSPSLCPLRTPYFVRATLNDSSQVGAIGAIIKFYGWREVIPIYEDTDYGTGIVPFLIDKFNSIDVRVPYRSVVPSKASDDWLDAELYKLKSMQSRVFVVHMMPALASRLFQHARAIGLMSPGYVWITTDGLTNALGTLGPTALPSMGGVLGVRSHVPKSNALAGFSARWRARFARDNPTVTAPVGPTAYQLWAYDAAWAVALAAEKAGKLNSGFDSPPRGSDNSTDLARVGVSRSGTQFLGAILGAQFRGLTGEFRLVDGQLQSSAFAIVNMDGSSWRGIGFWSPALKIIKDLKNVSDVSLKTVTWPGGSKEVPKGWEIPTKGKKFKIGVPVTSQFKEIINVETDNVTGQVKATGYSIEIFEAVMKTLPYFIPYEYEAFETDSYDSLISQVYFKRFDAVAGDITIIANRSLYVDFTLPYAEAGVWMVVPVKEDKSNKNAWIFLKPLTTDLWFASLAFFFFTGFVVWVIEHRINTEFRGPPSQQMGTIFYFAFSTIVFAHRERLQSNLSRFVVIIWVFIVLILTSSYTASLTSMLTVQQLQPAVTDLSELIKNGDYIGYQYGSFVEGFLKHQLNFDESKLRSYKTTDEYAEALSLGSKNGGVAAVFDEIPFLKLLLSKHCQDYAMVEPSYKNEGFGFAFPRGSPLVPDVSRAILNVTEGETMARIKNKWLGDLTACATDTSGLTTGSLSFRSFGGLFLITGCVSSLALLLFLATFIYKESEELKTTASQRSSWRKMVEWVRHFDGKDLSSHTFKDNGSNHSNPVEEAVAIPNIGESPQNPMSINLSDMNFGSPDVGNWSFRGESSAETAIEMGEIRRDNAYREFVNSSV